MLKKYLLTTFLIFLISITLFGIKIQKSDTKLIEKETFNNDYLFKGNELEFSGVADDLYFFGKRLNFTGETGSSLYAFGRELIINGKVKNNIMTGGVFVNLFGEIDDNAFITGKNIDVQKNSVINGALFIAGKSINLSGTINGNVYIGGANLTIDGTINGDIVAYTGKINITNNGVINGNLKYQSENELSELEKSRVTKSVEYNKNYRFNKHYRFNKNFNDIKDRNIHKFFKLIFIIFKFLSLIALIISGLLVLLFPIMKKTEEERSSKRFWFSSLWGLIPILIYMPIIFTLFMLGITIPLAFILVLAGFPLIFITKVLGITMLGQYLFKKFKWNDSKRFVYFLFGLVFYAILSFIPVIAFLSMIFFSSLGWGYILEGLFNRKFS